MILVTSAAFHEEPEGGWGIRHLCTFYKLRLVSRQDQEIYDA